MQVRARLGMSARMQVHRKAFRILSSLLCMSSVVHYKAVAYRIHQPSSLCITLLKVCTVRGSCAHPHAGVVPPISWMARFWWRSLVLLSNTNTIYSSTSKRDVRPGGRAGSGGGDSASERARPGAAPASPAAAAAAAAPPPPPPPGSTGFVARAAASTLRDQGEVSSTGGGGSGSGGGGGSLGGLDVMDPRALDTMLKALVKLKARPQGYWSR